MAIENVFLLHECCPKHLCIRSERMEEDMKQVKNASTEDSTGKEVKWARNYEVLKAYLLPRGRNFPKQWMNYLPTLPQ